jgi:hypothetical protein
MSTVAIFINHFHVKGGTNRLAFKNSITNAMNRGTVPFWISGVRSIACLKEEKMEQKAPEKPNKQRDHFILKVGWQLNVIAI